MTLAELRAELDALNLPDDTIVVLAKDAEGNGFSPLSVMDGALYEAHSSFSGDWYATDQMRAQNPENDWDQAPNGTVPAVFLWPTN
ncbi:hypothetical protein F7R91_14505 [Streptomyces luteolifulvus]|uniref:Uncharacterized protein n=1 Tax=Streptomyces luteolifulvus TaxID=2615112 RepID=A0A6H9V265_9ACTN|nr:hypothetical protein [Streptomyces luteolifulvus]KAB1146788.1 hypothetical protein F7R91_14505 [Streptomyces luteolifulvus]